MKPKSLGDYKDTVSIWGVMGRASEAHVGTPGAYAPCRLPCLPSARTFTFLPWSQQSK